MNGTPQPQLEIEIIENDREVSKKETVWLSEQRMLEKMLVRRPEVV